MSKEVIFEALAFLDGYNPSPSMQGMNDFDQIRETYIKNAIVSLVTIKQYNPKTDVGIVVNFEFDEKWKQTLDKLGIIIWQCSFDSFHMPQNIVYSLSYYKLCAFKYIINNYDYNKLCFIDCDTFAVKDFGSVWKECESAFMIVPGDEGLDHPVRKEITCLYEELYGKKTSITHYRSGFIIAQDKDIINIINRCELIYNKLMEIAAEPRGGDEVIWSLALADSEVKIYSPQVYSLLSNIGLRDYWVDKADYNDSHIVMWHLPTEKRYALIWAYDYYEKNGRVPSVEKMARACRIRKIRNRFSWLSIRAISKDSTALKRNILKVFKR